MEHVMLYVAIAVAVVMGIVIISRQQKAKPDADTTDLWHKDPLNWKMGVFYYNPADPRIFPPKQSKTMGWTVNFGNRVSVAAFVVFVIALTYVISTIIA